MRERIRDKSRLEHILQAIERIRRYTKGKTFDDFIADDMMYYAVVKNIEILGEASNMLTEEFREAHPNTPWKQVNGMRNYIVHEYFQVDNNVVWDVITTDLLILEKQIIEYIKEEQLKNRSSKDENSLLDRFFILWNPNEDVFLTFCSSGFLLHPFPYTCFS